MMGFKTIEEFRAHRLKNRYPLFEQIEDWIADLAIKRGDDFFWWKTDSQEDYTIKISDIEYLAKLAADERAIVEELASTSKESS